MKKAFIAIIILISIYAFQNNIKPIPLLFLYGFLAVAPVALIFIKNNLFRALLLWFFFAMFTKWGKIPLPMLPDISPERFIWVFIILFFITDITIERKRKMLPLTGVEILMILFCTLIVFSMINSGTFYSREEGLTIRSLLTGYFMPFSIFFLAKNIINSSEKIQNTYLFFAVIGLYLGFTAVCEYFELWHFVWPPYIKARFVGIHWGRARGPFLQAAVNGYVQDIIIIITIYLLFHMKNRGLKILLSFSIVLMLAGILLTFSRAAWLSFTLASLLFPLFFPQIRKVYLLCFLAVIITIYFKFNVDYLKEMEGHTWSRLQAEGSLEDKIATRTMKMEPIYGRITMYGVVWRIFLDKPFFGVGYNTFLNESPKYFKKLEGIPLTVHSGTNVHDTFSGILAELGLVGLVLYLAMLLQIIIRSIGLYRCLPSEGFTSKRLVVIFWGIFSIFFINMVLFQMRLFMFSGALFYLMAGIICGLHQRILLGNIVGLENNNFRENVVGNDKRSRKGNLILKQRDL